MLFVRDSSWRLGSVALLLGAFGLPCLSGCGESGNVAVQPSAKEKLSAGTGKGAEDGDMTIKGRKRNSGSGE